MAECWVILRGHQIYTIIQALHSLLYIVAKCHFFSVVTLKDIIKYLHKIWGVYSLLWDTVRSLRRWFSILVLADPLLCTFCMSPLFNTPDSDHQLVRREIHELNWVFQIRETYKMCRAVGPMDQDWKPLAYATQVMISSVKQSNTNVTPCLHRMWATWQNTKEVIIFSDAVYTGCCATWHISNRKLLPRSIYDVLTQISNDFQWSLYHVQCRQTLAIAVDTARYSPIRKKQSNLCVRSQALPLLEFTPALESWSDILLALSFRRCFPL